MAENYDILTYVAGGTGGKVFKGEHRVRKTIVAIKSIELIYPKKDLYKRLYREICVLKHLDSRYTLTLLDLYGKYENDKIIEVSLILPYMDCDLKSLISQFRLFYKQIIQITYQLLLGLQYLYESGIIHRDLKPSNIGINGNLELKILDFGLARDKQDDLTDYVVTRWYRPLEVFCTSRYTMAIDMWSAGCILTELCTKKVLFPGKTYTDQSICIMQTMGFPDDEMLDKMNNKDSVLGLQLFKSYAASSNQLENYIRKPIENLLWCDEEGCDKDGSDKVIDLICMMLQLDPDNRITPINALKSPLFLKHNSFISAYLDNGYPRQFNCPDFQEDNEDYWTNEIIEEINKFTPTD